jgi:membrane protease YdiL (CAAX protease family)
MFHGNITQIIYTFGAGLILAWVYAKTKKLIYPIILHMLINFFSSIPSLLIMDSYDRIMAVPEDQLENMMSDAGFMLDYIKVSAVGLMQYGFIIIGGFIFLRMLFGGKFKLDTKDEPKLGFFGTLRALVFNSGTILFVLYTIINVISNLFLPLLEEYMSEMV